MEQSQSTTADPPRARLESSPNRRGILWDETQYAAAMSPCSDPGDTGAIKTSVDDSLSPGVFHTNDPLWNQLHAIRRRLWILSATLELLPAKIEHAARKWSDAAACAGPDQPRRARSASSDDRPALPAEGLITNRWARRKITRLRSRAARAERRAAAAIERVSGSFGTALELVLQAAVARVKADEACTSARRAPGSQCRN